MTNEVNTVKPLLYVFNGPVKKKERKKRGNVEGEKS